MKSSLLSSTDNYTDDRKGWGIQKTCVYHLQLLPCPLPLPHQTPTHFIPNTSSSFSMVAGKGPVISATHHAKVSCSFQARQADTLYFICRLYFSCTFRKPLKSTHDTGMTSNKCDRDKFKFRLPNCPTNPQSEGKKLVILTAALPFEVKKH